MSPGEKRRDMVGNTDVKDRIECAQICNIIKKKAREDNRKFNQEIKREMIMTSKSLRKVRRTQKLG